MAGIERYDVVVVGAGVAGLAAAALLAKDLARRVLVVERAPFIGGRAVSFVGRGDKVLVDGLELDAVGLKRALAHARTFVADTDPDLDTIFRKGLLDGYTFEAGGHGLFWGNNSRVRCLLDHLGEPIDLPVNRGFAFVDHAGGNKAYQVLPRRKYPWMSDQGYAATMAVLRDMAACRVEDAAALMQVSLADWLRPHNLPPDAYDYIKILAASQTVQAEPAMTPAGDFLPYMSTARAVGMNLISGSVATAHEPGTIAIPQAMEKVLLAHGGEVRRRTTVERVIVEDGRATGVVLRDAAGAQAVAAEAVVCTIPPKYLFDVVPRRAAQAGEAERLEQKYWGAGLLSAFIGLRRDVWKDKGIDERSFLYMPGIIRGEGYIGDVDVVMWGLATVARRAPAGKRSFEFSIALTDREMRDRDKVRRVTRWCDAWFRKTFPSWKEDVEFCIWTPSPEAYGLWRPLGSARPDVASPHVRGLYFAGDQYGRRLWGGGVDGASLSAVMCVDAIAGSNLEDEVFPPHHRGLPRG